MDRPLSRSEHFRARSLCSLLWWPLDPNRVGGATRWARLRDDRHVAPVLDIARKVSIEEVLNEEDPVLAALTTPHPYELCHE
jgi:hypothetical protein